MDVLLHGPCGGFSHHGHSIDDPSEDPYLGQYDRKGNDDLHPRGEISLAQGDVPLEGDHGVIESIDDNAAHRYDGRDADKCEVSMRDAIEKQEAGNENEAEDFKEEPVSHGGCQKGPVLAMDENEKL